MNTTHFLLQFYYRICDFFRTERTLRALDGLKFAGFIWHAIYREPGPSESEKTDDLYDPLAAAAAAAVDVAGPGDLCNRLLM